MTTAIYARVSSKSQDTAAQELDLKRWEAAHDGEVRWYRDKRSGRTMNRPGMDRLMDDIRAGRIRQILVWRLDRLGRTVIGLVQLFQELQDRKVNLVSLRDGLDLNTAGGRLLANVLASVAAYEAEIRAERQLVGIEVAKEAGVKFGRPSVGVGNGKAIKVTPEQEATIKRMKGEGEKIATIARTVGLTRPTIYKVLRSA